MLPDDSQHAHHKLSCMFTLDILQELRNENKQIPIVLAGTESYEQYTEFSALSRVVTSESIIRRNPVRFVDTSGIVTNSIVRYTEAGSLVFQFDRRQGFGVLKRLTYHIPVNWSMAEHKSQGSLHLDYNIQNYENYWVFEEFTQDEQLQQIYDLFVTLNDEL